MFNPPTPLSLFLLHREYHKRLDNRNDKQLRTRNNRSHYGSVIENIPFSVLYRCSSGTHCPNGQQQQYFSFRFTCECDYLRKHPYWVSLCLSLFYIVRTLSNTITSMQYLNISCQILTFIIAFFVFHRNKSCRFGTT